MLFDVVSETSGQTVQLFGEDQGPQNWGGGAGGHGPLTFRHMKFHIEIEMRKILFEQVEKCIFVNIVILEKLLV